MLGEALKSSGIDWTMVGVLLTAFFTGAIVLTSVAIEWRRQRENKRRYETKELFGELMHELTTRLLYACSEDEFDDWWTRTCRLSEAALGGGEQHWIMDPVPGGLGVTDTEEKRLILLRRMHLRLQTLIGRMDTVGLRPGFDPKRWPSHSGQPVPSEQSKTIE